MDRTLGSAVYAPIPPTKRVSAKVALVDTHESSTNLLADCFKQFNVEPVILGPNAGDRLRKEKFEACVVRLGPGADTVMEAARSSASNSRMIIYGLGGTAQDALRFSKYGVNVVFNEPLERTAALKLVRATQMLLLHEFRRYVRIPVITEISVVMGERRFSATSKEISSGGMSLRTNEEIAVGQPIEISFALLTLPRIWVRGTVSWRKAASKTFGMRFDAHDERRQRIKEWVDAYFEN